MSTGTLEALLKKYKGAISTADTPRERPMFSLGPLSLNLAIGDPAGVPAGRIVQIVGRYSSGKSTLALDIISQYQRSNTLQVAYIDFERALDTKYAAACGVDLPRVLHVRPDTTEDGFDITEALIRSGDIKLIIIDSIAAAKPSSEENKDYADPMKMASNAGIITRFCNRTTGLIDNYDVIVVMLNQLRMNFNTLSPEKEIPFGGKALHYATSVMIGLTAVKNEVDTMTVQAIIKKNRVGAPRHKTEFKIRYGQGIAHDLDILMLALEAGIVQKSGAWYRFEDFKAQGEENAVRVFPIDRLRTLVLGSEFGFTADEVNDGV